MTTPQSAPGTPSKALELDFVIFKSLKIGWADGLTDGRTGGRADGRVHEKMRVRHESRRRVTAEQGVMLGTTLTKTLRQGNRLA